MARSDQRVATALQALATLDELAHWENRGQTTITSALARAGLASLIQVDDSSLVSRPDAPRASLSSVSQPSGG